MRFALAALFAFVCQASAAAQTGASLGMVGSILEYDGFLASGAATLSGALRFDTPTLALGGQGSWTVFESGNPIFQTTAAAAWLTQPRERLGFELSGTAGAFRYADEPATGHLLARGRVHLFGNRKGGWIGATTGASVEGSAQSPIELAVGAWTTYNALAVVGTVTRTWVADNRYIDIAGAAKWSGKFELEARAGARPWAISDGRTGEASTGVWGEVSAVIPIVDRLALTLSGGSYPSDPVRRVLGAKYATAGLRIAVAGSQRAPLITLPPSVIAALQNDTNDAAVPRLEILPSGQGYSFRVHAAGARRVELMGDFTDWKASPLNHLGNGIWDIQVALSPGVHRLNLRVDGGEWLVPAGARPEEGEFGGTVGVVVIR